VEACVEEAQVEVQTTVAESSREGVVVEAGGDGVDVRAACGHEPQHGDRAGAEAGVEEVGRVRVAGVRPTAPRL
jgi:hypothetical protein